MQRINSAHEFITNYMYDLNSILLQWNFSYSVDDDLVTIRYRTKPTSLIHWDNEFKHRIPKTEKWKQEFYYVLQLFVLRIYYLYEYDGRAPLTWSKLWKVLGIKTVTVYFQINKIMWRLDAFSHFFDLDKDVQVREIQKPEYSWMRTHFTLVSKKDIWQAKKEQES